MREEIRCLILLVTRDCNLGCRYCYALGGEKKDYMTWETARRAVDYVAVRSRSFKIQFTGGEPLLHFPLVKKIIAYLENHPGSVTFQLQTNGTLIDRALARELKRLRIGLGVSLDGPPEVNDSLRPLPGGRGSTIAVIQGLQSLAAEGVRVGVTAVLTDESTRSLPRLVELASYLGNVHGISLDLLRPLGRGADSGVRAPDLDLLESRVRAALHRAEELAQLGGPRVRFREAERLRRQLLQEVTKEHYCYATTCQSMAVVPDGSVYPCASLSGLQEFFLGNIEDPNFSLARALEAKKWFRQRRGLPAGCKGCPQSEFCGGGCLVRAYAHKGRVDRPYEGDCRLKKIFWEWVRPSEKNFGRMGGFSVGTAKI
ncbi:MAG: radical SAM protein [Firmicutes bacterium]|nr:radical SAM protein [Bacillota bacterium]